MPTLLLRLAGSMQSWGTRSRFDERDSDLEPSKSGVIGLLCAALGVDRYEKERVLELAKLIMGVRIDQSGILRYDYQTAQNVIAADESKVHATAISKRYYLADAVFLVGLESEDKRLLNTLHSALKNPVWPLFLGRKSYVPSQPVFLEPPLNPAGLRDVSLEDALRTYPFLCQREKDNAPLKKRCLIESHSSEGSLRMDAPLGSFAERRFGARFVKSQEVTLHVSESPPA